MRTSIIEFIEQDLRVPLHPVQRVLLKLAYGLELGKETKFFVPKDWRSVENGVGWQMTECGYVEYLKAEGRFGGVGSPTEICWALGRRGGKSYLGDLIAVYEVLTLIQMDNPQKHYGLPGDSRINVLTISCDKGMMSEAYMRATGLVRRSGLLSPYLGNMTQTYTGFQTPEDVRREGAHRDNPQARASVRLTYRSSVSKGFRGASNAVVVLDEYAYLKEGESLRWVLEPGIVKDGKMFVVGTPSLIVDSEFGKFWAKGFDGKGRQSVRVPTWEMNPTIPLVYYEKLWEKNPEWFDVEFGAEFLTSGKKG